MSFILLWAPNPNLINVKNIVQRDDNSKYRRKTITKVGIPQNMILRIRYWLILLVKSFSLKEHFFILDLEQCEPNTCSGHGQCMYDANGLYFCHCDPGWMDTHCEESVNDCEPNPCHFGGTCEDKHRSYTCHCVSYKQGPRCEEGNGASLWFHASKEQFSPISNDKS